MIYKIGDFRRVQSEALLTACLNAVKDIPMMTSTLDLSWNNLGRLSAEDIVTIFEAITVKITAIDLSANQFNTKSSNDLRQIFAAIPKTVTYVGLGSNHLGHNTSSDVPLSIAAIPAGVTSIGSDTNDPISAEFLSAIPVNITSLDLSANSLWSQTTSQLISLFTAMPPSITSLNLYANRLGSFLQGINSAEGVAEAFKALPPSLTSLNLGACALNNLSTQQLQQLYKSLPYIQTIYLSSGEVGGEHNRFLRTKLKKIFPAVKNVILLACNNVSLDSNYSLDTSNDIIALDGKASATSLVNQCTRFFAKNKIEIKSTSISVELLEIVNEFYSLGS